MKTNLRVVGATALLAATVFFSGCGVDEDRLVELTGDKNFKQVKQAYVMSITMEKPKDKEIYAYWLEENGEKAEATFNAHNFMKKVNKDYSDGLKKVKEQMSKFQAEADQQVKDKKINYNWLRKIEREKTMASFGSINSSFIKNTYFPFLKKIQSEVRAIKQ